LALIAAVVDFLRQAQNHKSCQYDQQVHGGQNQNHKSSHVSARSFLWWGAWRCA